MTEIVQFSKESKEAAEKLSQTMKGLGFEREADLLGKASGILQVLSGGLSLLTMASSAMQTWNAIQSARAVANAAKAGAVPAMWPALAAGVAGAAIASGATAVIMRSTTIKADLSTDVGRANALAGVREAMA
jgi:hypothetical protein